MYAENYAKVIAERAKTFSSRDTLIKYFDFIGGELDNFSWRNFFYFLKEEKVLLKEAIQVDRLLRNVLEKSYGMTALGNTKKGYSTKFFLSYFDFSNDFELVAELEDWLEYKSKMENFICENELQVLLLSTYIYQNLVWNGIPPYDLRQVNSNDVRLIEGGVCILGTCLTGDFWIKMSQQVYDCCARKDVGNIQFIITPKQKRDLIKFGVDPNMLEKTPDALGMSGMICRYLNGEKLGDIETRIAKKYVELY